MTAVRLKIPSLLHLGDRGVMEVPGDSIAEVLGYLIERLPGFQAAVIDGRGGFSGHLMVVAQYAGEPTAVLVARPGETRPGLLELSILPIPEGGSSDIRDMTSEEEEGPVGFLRSFLFMPGDREKVLAKTATVAADAVIWDLEDAVAPPNKDAARGLIAASLKPGGYPMSIYVRVNAVSSGLCETDLAATVRPGLKGVVVAKAERADDLRLVGRTLRRLEGERGLPLGGLTIIPLIESALGLVRAHDLAAASDRVEAISFGGEDFTRDLGATRTKAGHELAYARGVMVVAAAAAGVPAIDTVYTDLDDDEGLAGECAHVRQLGFSGKLAIHPKQIETIHRAFSPTGAELDFARRVVEAAGHPAAENKGVIVVEGKMVDRPVVERAIRLLAQAQRN
ncbi:MAG TPA: CoA ester lyase [Bacillota bacterium]|jgi:citrate lyase subunit beta/citryl-CoA lyase